MGILSTFFNAMIRSAGHDAYRSTKRVVTDAGKQASRRTAIEADYDVIQEVGAELENTVDMYTEVDNPIEIGRRVVRGAIDILEKYIEEGKELQVDAEIIESIETTRDRLFRIDTLSQAEQVSTLLDVLGIMVVMTEDRPIEIADNPIAIFDVVPREVVNILEKKIEFYRELQVDAEIIESIETNLDQLLRIDTQESKEEQIFILLRVLKSMESEVERLEIANKPLAIFDVVPQEVIGILEKKIEFYKEAQVDVEIIESTETTLDQFLRIDMLESQSEQIFTLLRVLKSMESEVKILTQMVDDYRSESS